MNLNTFCVKTSKSMSSFLESSPSFFKALLETPKPHQAWRKHLGSVCKPKKASSSTPIQKLQP